MRRHRQFLTRLGLTLITGSVCLFIVCVQTLRPPIPEFASVDNHIGLAKHGHDITLASVLSDLDLAPISCPACPVCPICRNGLQDDNELIYEELINNLTFLERQVDELSMVKENDAKLIHNTGKQLLFSRAWQDRIETEHEKLKKANKKQVGENEKGLDPSGKSILLLTGYSGKTKKRNPDIINQMLENRKRYTERHGYQNIAVDLDSYITQENEQWPKAWLKLKAIQDAFFVYSNVEWVLWLDTNAIIMNEDIDLAEHILHPKVLKKRLLYDFPVFRHSSTFEGTFSPSEINKLDEVDILLTHDAEGINADVLLIRRSKFILEELIPMWTNQVLTQKKFTSDEQGSLIYLMLRKKQLFNRIGLISQITMNCYDESYQLEAVRWKEGDFIVHFGNWPRLGDYEMLWADYWKKGPGRQKDHHPKELNL